MEKADSSSVLPSPLSISTKSKMTFLFANLKDRDFLVQRISDFLQKMPSKPPGNSRAGRKASIVDSAPEVRGPFRAVGWGSGPGEEPRQPCGTCLGPWVGRVPAWCRVENLTQPQSQVSWPHTRCLGSQPSLYAETCPSPPERHPCLPQVLFHIRSLLCLAQPPSSLSLMNSAALRALCLGLSSLCLFTCWEIDFSHQSFLQGYLLLQSFYYTNNINNNSLTSKTCIYISPDAHVLFTI